MLLLLERTLRNLKHGSRNKTKFIENIEDIFQKVGTKDKVGTNKMENRREYIYFLNQRMNPGCLILDK